MDVYGAIGSRRPRFHDRVGRGVRPAGITRIKGQAHTVRHLWSVAAREQGIDQITRAHAVRDLGRPRAGLTRSARNQSRTSSTALLPDFSFRFPHGIESFRLTHQPDKEAGPQAWKAARASWSRSASGSSA